MKDERANNQRSPASSLLTLPSIILLIFAAVIVLSVIIIKQVTQL